MTIRVLSIIALTTVLASSTMAASSYQPENKPGGPPAGRGPGGRAGRPDGQGGGGPSVEAAMKSLNRGFRQLREQVAAPAKKDDNLRIIAEMQRAVIGAKVQQVPPPMLNKAPDDAARAKLAASFRTELNKALRNLLDLEDAVAEGKTDAAKAKLEAMQAIRDHGHETMGVGEEPDEPGKPDGEKKGDKDHEGKPGKDKSDHDKPDKDKPGKGG